MPLKKNRKREAVPSSRKRVLIEFPSALLERTDEAAKQAKMSRSQFIRAAVERFLNDLEKEKTNAELALACQANAERNLHLLKEFSHVDREGF